MEDYLVRPVLTPGMSQSKHIFSYFYLIAVIFKESPRRVNRKALLATYFTTSPIGFVVRLSFSL